MHKPHDVRQQSLQLGGNLCHLLSIHYKGPSASVVAILCLSVLGDEQVVEKSCPPLLWLMSKCLIWLLWLDNVSLQSLIVFSKRKASSGPNMSCAKHATCNALSTVLGGRTTKHSMVERGRVILRPPVREVREWSIEHEGETVSLKKV